MGGTWQSDLKLLADGIDLSLDGVPCHGAPCPTLGHQGANQNSLGVKEGRVGRVDLKINCRIARFRQAEAMQCEMWGARDRAASEGSLELRAGF